MIFVLGAAVLGLVATLATDWRRLPMVVLIPGPPLLLLAAILLVARLASRVPPGEAAARGWHGAAAQRVARALDAGVSTVLGRLVMGTAWACFIAAVVTQSDRAFALFLALVAVSLLIDIAWGVAVGRDGGHAPPAAR